MNQKAEALSLRFKKYKKEKRKKNCNAHAFSVLIN